MDKRQIAVRATDMGRVLDRYESPVLGNYFRATLPVGRIVRLLISLQGQNVIKRSVLESIAHKEVGITPLELDKVYLPLFQERGFMRILPDKIEETIKSRNDVLGWAGKMWGELNPHDVEKLGIELFDAASIMPRKSDDAQKILDKFDNQVCENSIVHLSESGLVDKFPYKDTEWYYSPEVFAENYQKTIKFISNQREEERKKISSIINIVLKDQGIPHETIASCPEGYLINQMVGAGLLMGYPITVGDSDNLFYFTPDLRNRFEREGRGDKFELIKTGVSLFQFAYRLADAITGKLKFSPYVLLDKLIEKGKAGNATAIGTDYFPLLQKGLVKIERTSGNRCQFLLPDSKEKISDLETVRDAFKTKLILPRIKIPSIPGIVTGDSISYRSRTAMKGRALARGIAQEVFKL